MTDTDCPFCEIVRHEDLGAREVYRDGSAVAFFPTEPATLGHTLLIPRIHVPNIWTLPGEVASHLGMVSVRLATAIKDAIEPDGLNVIQSNGTAATQTVPHLHIHLVPRWKDDAIGRIWPPETHYSDEEKDDVWQKLKTECRKLSSQ